MNFVPCLAWVKSGAAKSVPEKLQLDGEELKRLIEEAKADYKDTLEEDCESDDQNEGDEDTAKENIEESANGNIQESQNESTQESAKTEARKLKYDDDEGDIDSRYNMDDYDNDESETNPIFNIAGLTLYADSKDDPYITGADDEDEQEEEEDFKLKKNDNLLVVGHVESDSSILEIYVYNKEEDDLYVHHDIVLPAYPLAIEWLNYHPGDEHPGNYVAIGDMTSVIKIWDLDIVDILEPECILGEKKKKKKKKSETSNIGHTDAVLDLTWNKSARNILASGSADCSICLWNLDSTKVVSQMIFHADKVQSLKFHPSEVNILLSGGCDGLVNLYDCANPTVVSQHWSVDGEVERILWNPFDSNFAFCSTDGGYVYGLDIRTDKVAYTIKAHNDAVTGLDASSLYPGCLVTASTDRTFKVWDVTGQPKFLVSKKMKLGSLYVAKSNPNHPFTFAFGGDNQSLNLKVVDLMGITECSEHFDMNLLVKKEEPMTENLEQFGQNLSTPVNTIKEEPIASGSFSGLDTGASSTHDVDCKMETDSNDFQELNLNCDPVGSQSEKTFSSQEKKSKKKNKFKNKKRFR